MKNYYFLIALIFSSLYGYTQSYELGIVHVSNHDFKIVAIPDFTSSGNTDASDIGFTLVLPAGSADAINPVGLLTARPWTIQQFDATFLTGLGLGDGTKDVFQFNLPPGQSVFSHTSGQQIDLVSFTVSNSPLSGDMYFLLNSDSIATGAGGVLDSFYNSNIDATTTQDYFSAPASGLDSFMFSTLSNNTLVAFTKVSIYPNPTSQYINIETTQSIKNVEVFNILGKHVLSSSSKKINVSNFQTGLYLITIHTEHSKLTKRIVIE